MKPKRKSGWQRTREKWALVQHGYGMDLDYEDYTVLFSRTSDLAAPVFERESGPGRGACGLPSWPFRSGRYDDGEETN